MSIINLTEKTAKKLYIEAGWSETRILEIAELLEGNECSVYEDYVVIDNHIFLKGKDPHWDRFDFLRFKSWSSEPISCYTDGSGTTKDKPGGVGVYITSSLGNQLLSYHIESGTNNYAELYGVFMALLKITNKNANLTIYTDSKYAIGSSTEDWAAKCNVGLIKVIKNNLKLRKNVSFHHVNGHVGIAGNEIADSLANIGRRYL